MQADTRTLSAYPMQTRASLDEDVVQAALDRNKFNPQTRAPELRLRSSVTEGPSVASLGGQAESVTALTTDNPVIVKARRPVALEEAFLETLLTEPKNYIRILNICAQNVIKGDASTEDGQKEDAAKNLLNMVRFKCTTPPSGGSVTILLLPPLLYSRACVWIRWYSVARTESRLTRHCPGNPSAPHTHATASTLSSFARMCGLTYRPAHPSFLPLRAACQHFRHRGWPCHDRGPFGPPSV